MTTSGAKPNGLPLRGLDGSNPLAFLAALGTLRTLSLLWPDRQVRMAWTQYAGAWRPALSDSHNATEDEVIDALMAHNEALKSATTEEHADVFDVTALGEIIGVAPEVFAAFTDQALRWTAKSGSRASRREGADFVAAYGAATCLADRGTVEPTQFSFANGQSGQSLLKSFRELRDGLTAEHLHGSLCHSWGYADPRPTLRWDPSDCRPYAHLATDPGNSSTTPIRTMRGANYLAFLGLPLLPTVPGRHGLATTGFIRLHRQWTWSWPIWTPALGGDSIRSLLALRDLQEPAVDRRSLRQRGVAEVFRSRRFSYQKGIYFSPASSA